MFNFILTIAACVACALASESGLQCMTPQSDIELWGTYRPHTLMSVRASIPHSPAFGVMYHAPGSTDIRHLAADHSDEIRSFSFKRHDGRFFAEHEVEDIELNTVIMSTFLSKPEESTWLYRVSGRELDRRRKASDVSVVFYASVGPEELDATWNATSDTAQSGPWGNVGLSSRTDFVSTGVAGDCLLEGEIPGIGGTYTLTVREPSEGSIKVTKRVDSSPYGSRRMRRRRSQLHSESSDLGKFHVTAPVVDHKEAFLVEELLKSRLVGVDEFVAYGLKTNVDASADSKGPSQGSTARKIFVLDDQIQSGAPVVLVQRIVHVPFEIDMVFTVTKDRSAAHVRKAVQQFAGQVVQDEIRARRSAFDDKFESLFGLKRRGYSRSHQTFARRALANLLGGIGYFYGRTVMKEAGEDVFRDPVTLVTSTPSRAVFPRGFLWDEGFHQLVIQKWDSSLSSRCISSWLNTMDASGWIPREQVLGLEARYRFPQHIKHLMIQSPDIANPPTLLMPLRVLAATDIKSHARQASNVTEERKESVCAAQSKGETCGAVSVEESSCSMKSRIDFWKKYLEQAALSVAWLQRTQAGDLPNSFRWRGRTASMSSPQGYPLTLASGLDDHPRGDWVNDNERHLDLHCWMIWATGSLAKINHAADLPGQKYMELRDQLMLSLEKYHSHVKFVSKSESSSRDLLCDYDGEAGICFDGYVTILPLLLGVLDPENTRVGVILDMLEERNTLRSPAGIRSLSRQSRYYRKGDDYWTGSVWMPFNYLTLAALWTKYSVEEGPYKDRAKALYSSLKADVISNALDMFEKTGYLWENYSPDDGSGKSGKQFTGWSSLVLLIYSDMYDGVL